MIHLLEWPKFKALTLNVVETLSNRTLHWMLEECEMAQLEGF